MIACLLAATHQLFAVPPQHSQSVDQQVSSLTPVVQLMNLLLRDALAETIMPGTDAAAHYYGYTKGQQDSAVQQLAAWDKQLDQWPAASPEVLSLSDVEHIATRACSLLQWLQSRAHSTAVQQESVVKLVTSVMDMLANLTVGEVLCTCMMRVIALLTCTCSAVNHTYCTSVNVRYKVCNMLHLRMRFQIAFVFTHQYCSCDLPCYHSHNSSRSNL